MTIPPLHHAVHMLISVLCLIAILLGTTTTVAQPKTQATSFVYLPIVMRLQQIVPFGIETRRGRISNALVGDRARQLGVKWWRQSVLWGQVQATRGGPYNLAGLAAFDRDLQVAIAAGLTPMIRIHDSPSWATINQPYPTSCGAIRTDRFSDFAAFAGWLAARYKDRVQYWELGNEPDIDPKFVQANQVFGCWGDVNDPYYGGEHYGEMLKVVTPAIKRANPQARVLIGGLALPEPETTDPALGKPENFFEGILRAGAGDSFDIVAFHSYPWFSNHPLDYDYDADTLGPWRALGGMTLGKAKFLRAVMARYKVEKPLFLNETAMTCAVPPEGTCPGPGPVFYRAQANYLIRMLTRGWAAHIQQFNWYTLEWPTYREGSLLDENQYPRQAYIAYQQFLLRAVPSDPPVRVYDYDRTDVSVETYRFDKGATMVDVLWGKDLSTYYVKTPPGFMKAYDQYGAELTPIGPYLPVSFSAIYIQHRR